MSFHHADSQELKCFEDGQFDRVLANLSLMIVPDAQKMLDSVHRVLQKNGRFSFSVWGRKETCEYFTFVGWIL